MSSPIIIAKKMWTRKEILESMEAPGRTRGRTAGSWVSDIAAQKKCIILCPLCTNKFNPKRAGYRREKDFPYATGKCDGCGVLDNKCSWYIHEPLYTEVRCTKDEQRALHAWREKALRKGSLEWNPPKF
jgi:Pyruvate/2-oxoacid:ferredoxin oxidoreductase delta subunit